MAKYSILVLGCLFFLATLVRAGVWRNRRFAIPHNRDVLDRFRPEDLNGFNPDAPDVWKKWNALIKHGTLHGLVDLFGPFNIAEFYSRIAALASKAKERIDDEEGSYGYGYELNGIREKRECNGCTDEQGNVNFRNNFPFDSSEDNSFSKDFPYSSSDKSFGKDFPYGSSKDGSFDSDFPYDSRKKRQTVRNKRECYGCSEEQENFNFRDNFPYGSSEDNSFGNNFPFNSPNKNEPFGNEFPFDNQRPVQKPKPKNGIDPLYSLLANLSRSVFRSEAAARFFEKYNGRQRYDELF